MKRPVYFFILFLLITASCKKPGTEISVPDYSLNLECDRSYLCCNDKDEIIIIGVTGAPLYNELQVIKTDQYANLIWHKQYTIDLGLYPRKILNNGENSYFIAAEDHFNSPIYSEGHGILILKIDDNGNIIHQNLLDHNYGLNYHDMIDDGFGGVFVTGWPNVTNEDPGYVTRISHDGEIMFEHQFPWKTEHIVQYPIGELCYMEFYWFPNDTTGVKFHLTSPYGDELYNGYLQYSYPYNFSCFSTDPQHLIFLLYGKQKNKLLKADFSGNTIWSSDISYPNDGAGTFWDLRKIEDYYYMITDSEEWPQIITIIKYDDNGQKLKVLRNELYGVSYYSDLQFVELSNGSIALIQPSSTSNGCQWNNCTALQIFE